MKRKYITPLDWSKAQLLDAWNEEKLLKEKIIVERDRARSDWSTAQAARQAAEAKVKNLDELRIREERRANIAEAELAKAHKALVIAVTRLGER